MRARTTCFGLLAALTLVAGCNASGANLRVPERSEYNDDSRRARVLGAGGPTAGDPIVLFGTDRSRSAAAEGGQAGLGVNAYLWRATLDTLSFMPLASADPFGGVVITDWYSPPAAPGERFKATAYVLGRQLRSDGVRISLFRQLRAPNGQWVDAPVSTSTGSELEDRVLARARELRSQSALR